MTDNENCDGNDFVYEDASKPLFVDQTRIIYFKITAVESVRTECDGNLLPKKT